ESQPVVGLVDRAGEALAAVLPTRLGIALVHRGRDPERVTVVDEALQGGHEPAAATYGMELPVLAALERRRAAVRDEEQRRVRAHWRPLKMPSQSRRSRGVRKCLRTCSLPARPSCLPRSGSRRILSERSAHSSAELTR